MLPPGAWELLDFDKAHTDANFSLQFDLAVGKIAREILCHPSTQPFAHT
jgi:hypothetical protein